MRIGTPVGPDSSLCSIGGRQSCPSSISDAHRHAGPPERITDAHRAIPQSPALPRLATLPAPICVPTRGKAAQGQLTHSSVPSANTCRFHTGSRCLTSSTRRAHISNASRRCAVTPPPPAPRHRCRAPRCDGSPRPRSRPASAISVGHRAQHVRAPGCASYSSSTTAGRDRGRAPLRRTHHGAPPRTMPRPPPRAPPRPAAPPVTRDASASDHRRRADPPRARATASARRARRERRPAIPAA